MKTFVLHANSDSSMHAIIQMPHNFGRLGCPNLEYVWQTMREIIHLLLSFLQSAFPMIRTMTLSHLLFSRLVTLPVVLFSFHHDIKNDNSSFTDGSHSSSSGSTPKLTDGPYANEVDDDVSDMPPLIPRQEVHSMALLMTNSVSHEPHCCQHHHDDVPGLVSRQVVNTLAPSTTPSISSPSVLLFPFL